MKLAAKKLNLKPHRCRVALRKNKPKLRTNSRHLRESSDGARHNSGDFRFGSSPARNASSNASPLTSPTTNYSNGPDKYNDNTLSSSQSSSDADVYETPMLTRSYSSEDEFDEGTDFLYSPADLEGHKGRVSACPTMKHFLNVTHLTLLLQDGKFYLLDFSRVLPPETPNPQ